MLLLIIVNGTRIIAVYVCGVSRKSGASGNGVQVRKGDATFTAHLARERAFVGRRAESAKTLSKLMSDLCNGTTQLRRHIELG